MSMDDKLNAEELAALQSLSTDEPIKPTPPAATAERLVAMGYAIALVEGGLQLTSIGRERLTQQG